MVGEEEVLRESALHQKQRTACWECCRASEPECGLCMFHKILKITARAPHSVLSSLQAGVKVGLACTWRNMDKSALLPLSFTHFLHCIQL